MAHYDYLSHHLICNFLTIFLVIWTAMAGVRGAIAAEALLKHPATAGPIITDNAVPVPPGQLNMQPYWSLGFVAGIFSTNWHRASVGGNFRSLEIPVKLTYGLAPNIELNLMAVMFHNWASQVQAPGTGESQTASFTGLGDLYFTGKYQLLEETAWRPTVTALISVNFPTGHFYRLNPGRLSTDALGGGAFAFTPGVNLAKWIGPVYLYANLWYSFPIKDVRAPANQQHSPLLLAVAGRDLITGNLAAEWVLSPRWVALLECYTSWSVGPLLRYSREAIAHSVGILPGMEYIISPRCSAALGVAIELVGKNSFYCYTPIFTVIMTY